MSLIRIDHDPSRRQLAVFGIAWLVFFAALGGIVFARGGSPLTAAAIWALAVVVPAVGWCLPGVMRIVYLAMAYAAFPIGIVISHLLLMAVYYLVLTPTGLLMRLFGYDPMQRDFDSQAETYWHPRPEHTKIERYFRQF